MQQIINNHLYDTDKAVLIYEDNNFWKPRSYYQTPRSTFFCLYKRTAEIGLISEEVMKEILAKNDVAKYIEIFGKVEEG